MDFAEFERRFFLLEPLIRETGRHVREKRKTEQIDIIIKPDGSPVTNLDLYANKRICTFIEENFTGEVVIGEESDQKQYKPGTSLVWYVDPIDGTKAFIDGREGYFVLIGLCLNGVPVFGMICQPEKDLLMYGWTGMPAMAVNGTSAAKVIKTGRPSWSQNSPIVMKAIGSEHRSYFHSRYNIARAPFQNEMIDMLGSLYGISNGYISFRPTAYWDLCAPAALLRASGYMLAGEAGDEPVLFNDGTIATNFYYCLPPDTPEPFLQELRIRQHNSY